MYPLARLFIVIFLPVGICSPSPQPPDQRNDHGGDKPYFEQGRPDRQRHQAEKAEHHRHEDRTREIEAHDKHGSVAEIGLLQLSMIETAAASHNDTVGPKVNKRIGPSGTPSQAKG